MTCVLVTPSSPTATKSANAASPSAESTPRAFIEAVVLVLLLARANGRRG